MDEYAEIMAIKDRLDKLDGRTNMEEAKSNQFKQLEKASKEVSAMIPNDARWVTLPGYVVSLENRLSDLEKRSGLLSSSLSRQLWALFGRLVLLWIILGSVWLAVVLLAYAVSGG